MVIRKELITITTKYQSVRKLKEEKVLTKPISLRKRKVNLKPESDKDVFYFLFLFLGRH